MSGVYKRDLAPMRLVTSIVVVLCLYEVSAEQCVGKTSSVTATACDCDEGSSPLSHCHTCDLTATMDPLSCEVCRDSWYLMGSLVLPTFNCFESCADFNWTVEVGRGSFSRRCASIIDIASVCKTDDADSVSTSTPWLANRCIVRNATCLEDEYDVSAAIGGATAANPDVQLCIKATECTEDEFVSADLTTTTDRVCEPTTSTLTTTTQTATSSTQTDTTTGTTVTQTSVTATSVTTATVPPCDSPAEYESVPQTATSTRICLPVSGTCTSGQFEAAAPTRTSDRDCRLRSKCVFGVTYETQPPTDSSDRLCVDVSVCSATQFIAVNATLTSDLTCANVSTCEEDREYISTPLSTYADITCSAVKTCNASEYEVAPPDATTDRTCTTVSDCLPYHPEVVPATATTDRECGSPPGLADNEATFVLMTPTRGPVDVADLANVISALQNWVHIVQGLPLVSFRVFVQLDGSDRIGVTIQYPADIFFAAARDGCEDGTLVILTDTSVLDCIGESFLPLDSTTTTSSSTTTRSTFTGTTSTVTSTSKTMTTSTVTTTTSSSTSATSSTMTTTSATSGTSSVSTVTTPTTVSTVTTTTSTFSTTTISTSSVTGTSITSTAITSTSITSSSVSSTSVSDTTVTMSSVTKTTISSTTLSTTYTVTTTTQTSRTVTTSTTTTFSSTTSTSTASSTTVSSTSQTSSTNTQLPFALRQASKSDDGDDVVAGTAAWVVLAVGLVLIIFGVVFVQRSRNRKKGGAVISHMANPDFEAGYSAGDGEQFDEPVKHRPAPLVLSPMGTVDTMGMPTGPSVRGVDDVGKRVFVVGYGSGTLRYYGRHAYMPGFRCGVELDEPNGKNNGTVEGYYYFWCSDNFGVLVDIRKVSVLTDGAMSAMPPMTPAATSFGGDIGDLSIAEGDSRAVQIRDIQRQLAMVESVFANIPKRRADADYTSGSNWTSKNRYADIMPYEDTRVKLSGHEDYINASYVKFSSPSEAVNAICCQGPTNYTVEDTWRMVAEQNIEIIIMLTNTEEGGRAKCAQYWPDVEGGSIQCGDVEIIWTHTDTLNNYVVRYLTVSHHGVSRSVYQVHFTGWPDHGVPDDARDFLAMMHTVATLKRKATSRFSPVLVHCSAGVGRTGVFLMASILEDKLKRRIVPDLGAILLELRRQRMLLVQTSSQFAFCHEAAVALLNSPQFEYL